MGASDALERLVGAVAIARQEHRQASLATWLQWLAWWHLGRREWPEARHAAEESLAVAAQQGLVLVELAGYWALGRAEAGLERHEAALSHFWSGFELARRQGDLLFEALCQFGIGRCSEEGQAMQEQAARHLEAILQPMSEAEREAFLRFPERREIAEREKADYEPLFAIALAIVGQRTASELARGIVRAGYALTGGHRGYLFAQDAVYDADGREVPRAEIEFDASAFDEATRGPLAFRPTGVHAVPLRFAGKRLGVLYLEGEPREAPAPGVRATLSRLGELAGAFLSRV